MEPLKEKHLLYYIFGRGALLNSSGNSDSAVPFRLEVTLSQMTWPPEEANIFHCTPNPRFQLKTKVELSDLIIVFKINSCLGPIF